MEAIDLARWTRFAAKGGIGKCTALVDCVAENSDDLMFLKGYCEGVVGRFYGSDVHFHGRLKKPVMAKRSSVNANSNAAARKSPTPAVTRARVSIDEHVAASLVLPPSSPETLPSITKMGKLRLSIRPGSRSSAGQERSDGEYGSSRDASPAMPSTLSPALKSTPLSIHAASPPPPLASYTSPKLPLRASISSSKHTSVILSYSQVAEYDEEPSLVNTSVDTVTNANSDTPGKSYQSISSPPTTTMTVTSFMATTTTTATKSMPPTLPASISTLSNSSLYASSSGTSVAPTTTPSTSSTITSPPPTSLPSASTNPDTSKSAFFDKSRLSLASDDGEVGIGLSLLQNLVDGDGWSGSESDSEGNTGTRRKASVRRKGSAQRRTSLRRRSTRTSVISEASTYSSEDGLNYADTETGHSSHSHALVNLTQEDLEVNISRTQAAFSHLDDDDIESPVLGRYENRKTITQDMMTFPPVAPLSLSPSRFTSSANEGDESYPSTYEFPTPPTHTHREYSVHEHKFPPYFVRSSTSCSRQHCDEHDRHQHSPPLNRPICPIAHFLELGWRHLRQLPVLTRFVERTVVLIARERWVTG
ncbi:hypothetical protein C0995_003184 [Termitomyces sp. Mi166|nr:hypothetical protein C0995_003184 [Termitomyces sp. Mi166\